jgi:cystathionine beta-lyase/cystathionine gamma-synthase
MPILPTDVEICLNDAVPSDYDGAAPVSTPLVQTSLFSFPTFDALLAGLASEHTHHVYTRGQNPTVEAVERKLAALERGEACKCFGSGMAAISGVLLGLLRSGDHVVFVNHTYGPTLQLADRMQRFGIEHTVLLDGEYDAIEAALRPETRLIWLESPGTMLFRVLDVPRITALARSRVILTCIDNSWATPLFQKPIGMGVDIVVHTCSKYLNGHSDVMAGAVITTAERMREIFYGAFLLNGGILSPHDAWLLLRGLRTLPARLRQHEADGLKVAEFLRAHEAVRRVFHPAFQDDRERVDGQLTGFTGVFSFELARADFSSVARFIDGLRRFRIGVSWGGVESLVISPNRGDNLDGLDAQGIPPGLVRLSVGLEGADTLVADLDAALSTVLP